jgi:hypothetical protein
MAELCTDTRRGKKSNRERELERLESERKARRARERLAERLGEDITAINDTDAAAENSGGGGSGGGGDGAEGRGEQASASSPQQQQQQQPQQRSRAVPGLRWVNGNIVIDDQSLQIDRHATAAADAAPLEEVEEHELSRRITSASFLPPRARTPAAAWTPELTERFYAGLRAFGTDFMLISHMFPPGQRFTRRQIKLKFGREERAHPQRVRDALLGPRLPDGGGGGVHGSGGGSNGVNGSGSGGGNSDGAGNDGGNDGGGGGGDVEDGEDGEDGERITSLAALTRNSGVGEYADPAEFARELEREAREHAEEQERLEREAQERLAQKRAENAAVAAGAVIGGGGGSGSGSGGGGAAAAVAGGAGAAGTAAVASSGVGADGDNARGGGNARGKKGAGGGRNGRSKQKRLSRFDGGDNVEIVGTVD